MTDRQAGLFFPCDYLIWSVSRDSTPQHPKSKSAHVACYKKGSTTSSILITH